jgi:hypothetical protein
MFRTGFNWLITGFSSGNFCEHCNVSSGSTKGMKFIDQMSDYQLLNRKSDPMSYFTQFNLTAKAHLGGK